MYASFKDALIGKKLDAFDATYFQLTSYFLKPEINIIISQVINALYECVLLENNLNEYYKVIMKRGYKSLCIMSNFFSKISDESDKWKKWASREKKDLYSDESLNILFNEELHKKIYEYVESSVSKKDLAYMIEIHPKRKTSLKEGLDLASALLPTVLIDDLLSLKSIQIVRKINDTYRGKISKKAFYNLIDQIIDKLQSRK